MSPRPNACDPHVLWSPYVNSCLESMSRAKHLRRWSELLPFFETCHGGRPICDWEPSSNGSRPAPNCAGRHSTPEQQPAQRGSARAATLWPCRRPSHVGQFSEHQIICRRWRRPFGGRGGEGGVTWWRRHSTAPRPVI